MIILTYSSSKTSSAGSAPAEIQVELESQLQLESKPVVLSVAKAENYVGWEGTTKKQERDVQQERDGTSLN